MKICKQRNKFVSKCANCASICCINYLWLECAYDMHVVKLCKSCFLKTGVSRFRARTPLYITIVLDHATHNLRALESFDMRNLSDTLRFITKLQDTEGITRIGIYLSKQKTNMIFKPYIRWFKSWQTCVSCLKRAYPFVYSTLR